MSLEATVICIDNSEWMRNGDFSPSRFEAQQDACISICGSKTRQNPENSVGLIASAGRAVEVCVPLTQDLGKLIAALHKVKLSGESDVVSAIRVAQLALRHRQKTSKKQEQRIVLFVGSPVKAEKHELEDIGKQLKKNSVAIDIISFGEPNAQQNEEKLQALLTATNNMDESGKDNSHFVPIPTGNMSDVLIQMTGEQSAASAPMGDIDPEFAWALELSKQTFAQENKSTAAPSSSSSSSSTAPASTKDVEMKDTDDTSLAAQTGEEDPELMEAIMLSLQAEAHRTNAPSDSPAPPPASAPIPIVTPSSTPVTAPTPVATAPTVSSTTTSAVEDDDDLEQALKLSQETASEDKKRDIQKEEEKKEHKKPEEEVKEDMELDVSGLGSDLMESVLMGLPIDKNDPEVQKLIQAFKKDEKK
eukprot:TRINITY_DN1801_c0_g1_i1.p1 TRINITY_DN1801_c0_g1~~TRINITY_DN1801_c0_g1_i1.p1  ORF type:complete len:426 (+),score=122.63 TRINITY_DN1801_c0_g1_i1:27-1280(+)